MARKGENIYKRKDGRWEGRYLKRLPDGTTKYGYIYAATYRDARTKLRQAAALWEAQPHRGTNKDMLLSSVSLRWEESVAQQVKESTFVKYHMTVRKHLIPVLGKVSVEDMTHELIESFALSLLRGDGKARAPLAPRTVSDVLTVLRSILRFARRGGAIVPCDGSSVRIRRSPVEIRVLTPGEQETLHQYLTDTMCPRHAGILLSLYAGLRVGEICALKWEDMDLAEGLLWVRHTMQRIANIDPEGPGTKVVITAPKSISSLRTIPLPEDMIRILQTLPGEHRGFFLTSREDAWLEPRVMQYHFRRVLERSGIEKANYHALRHTFATRCVELGFDVKTLSELLGHSTVGMTLDRYVHPTLEHKREHMSRVSEFMKKTQN